MTAADLARREAVEAAPLLVSVVIETNQHDDDASISLSRVLDRLAEQTHPHLEVIVVVHEEAPGLAEFVADRFPAVRIARSESPHYYPMKVRGAADAVGDVIAFLDSDTLPERTWVESVARTIAAGADVSVGAMRYEPGRRGVRLRNFLDWGHIYADADGRASNLVSNSAAFRRHVWERHPFDVTLKRTGACYLLGEELKHAGYKLVYEPEQRIFHRDCYVGGEFVRRRLRGGFDSVLVGRRGRITVEGKARRLGPLAPAAVFAVRVSHDLLTLARRRREFGVRPLEVPLFFAAAVGARTIELAGAFVTLVRPEYFERRFDW